MNETTTTPNLLSAITGGKSIDFQVKLETKSLMILGLVIVLSAIIIIGFNKVVKTA